MALNLIVSMIVVENHLNVDFLIDAHGAYISENLLAENRATMDDGM
jgi:hypothetical protein